MWREASLPRVLWSGKQLWVIWGNRSRKLYQLACPKAAGQTICCCSVASNCPIFRERHSLQALLLTKEQASSVPRHGLWTARCFHSLPDLGLIFCGFVDHHPKLLTKGFIKWFVIPQLGEPHVMLRSALGGGHKTLSCSKNSILPTFQRIPSKVHWKPFLL